MYNPKTLIRKEDNWSKLTQLSMNNLNDCLSLENKMLSRMHNKSYTCSYIAKRDKNVFEKILQNREMYGVFNTLNHELIGMINISEQNKKDLLAHFMVNDNYLISDELISFYKKYNGCYCACLMTDLDPKNIGLGKYIISQSQDYILNNLKKDYLICDIHVKHQGSYKLFNKYLSFACSNKIISRIGVDNKETKIPIFYLTSILDKSISDKFEKCLKKDMVKRFLFLDDDISKIKENEQIDPILNNDEILITNSTQIMKIKIDLNKLREVI